MVHTRTALALAVILAALLCGVRALLASNMGFVVNCPLPALGPGSLTGSNTLNFPYQRDAQLVHAGDVLTDLGIANVSGVMKFLEPVDALTVYTGRKGGGPSFPLQSGEGYFIRMLRPVDYVIGGSSDPAVVLQLDAPGPASRSGTNLVALPYHATARTASELMEGIGFANVASVQGFVTETDGLRVYTGRKGSPPDFALDPCAAYFIKMNTTVNYVPSHY